MGNCLGSSAGFEALPVAEPRSVPSPLPKWPPGGGFANGSIDLGGIQVTQITTFTKIFTTSDDDNGATFFAASQIPDGFFALGSFAQPNNIPLSGHILVAKDTTNDQTALAKPLDYTLVLSSGSGFFWLPVAPNGYKSVGSVVTNSNVKPSLNDFRCVRNDFTDECESDTLIWTTTDGVGISTLTPVTRGIDALGVRVGTFAVKSPESLACLKNNASNKHYAMPNPDQVTSIITAYAPYMYLHPDETYLPSSVNWFFDNGGLLYQKDVPNGMGIDSNGSNLPQGGSNDGQYWLDLPVSNDKRNFVAKGDIKSTQTYVHLKPMFGGTVTDIAMWVYYPFNGPAKAKVGIVNIKLGKIGEHVGDWEHLTMRVSNFSGELMSVYFSEHSAGKWVDASELEYKEGNKFVAYASLHGHAFYAEEGTVLQGDAKLGIGIRNDTAKGQGIDTAGNFTIVSARYLGVSEPAWLQYMREWGPKIEYDIEKEIGAFTRLLPRKLKNALVNLVKKLPAEVLGEEGPTGPKSKDNWNMDERVDN